MHRIKVSLLTVSNAVSHVQNIILRSKGQFQSSFSFSLLWLIVSPQSQVLTNQADVWRERTQNRQSFARKI